MAGPRAATCVFCDDIRAEVGNKVSLMGIFGIDLLSHASGSIVLPKFAVAVWLIYDIDDAPSHITIRVLVPPNKSEIVKLEAQGSGLREFPYPPDEFSKGTLRIFVPITNLILSEEGFIEVMVDTERETLRAGRLRVRFNVPSEEMGLPVNAASAAAAPPS
jgi:hypothetical protein